MLRRRRRPEVALSRLQGGAVKAAAYLRVSSEDQAREGTSLDTQRRRCREAIEKRGWEPVDVYADEGVSGAKESRPDLDRLLAACRRGEVQAIVVTTLDRFTRKLLHQLKFAEELLALGVVIDVLDDPIDLSSPEGVLKFQLTGMLAEWERAVIARRTRQGVREVAALGRWPGGITPFGLRTTPDGAGHMRIEIDEDEARVLRHAAGWLAEGLGTQEVAQRLDAHGLTPRHAPVWDHRNLRRQLRQTYLGGKFTFGKRGLPGYNRYGKVHEPIEIEVPAILEPDVYEAVQRALRARARRPSQRRFYLLTGHLVGECGSTWTGYWRSNRNARLYQCSKSKCETCGARRIRADDVEGAVWDAISEVLTQPERLIALAEEYLGLRGQQVQNERAQSEDVERRIADHERALSTLLVRAALSDEMVASQQAIDQVEGRLATLRRQQSQLEAWRGKSAAESARKRQLWALADLAATRLGKMTPQEKAAVLDLLEVRVTVSDERPPVRLRIEGVVLDDALSTLQDKRFGRVVGRQGIEP